MIEAIDDDLYQALPQSFAALRPKYRDLIGPLPTHRSADVALAADG